MRNTAIMLLVVFVGAALGLTACGKQCSDVCRYAVLCYDEYPVLWANCNNFCMNISDCATVCNPDISTCESFHECVLAACDGFYFPSAQEIADLL